MQQTSLAMLYYISASEVVEGLYKTNARIFFVHIPSPSFCNSVVMEALNKEAYRAETYFWRTFVELVIKTGLQNSQLRVWRCKRI